LDASLRGRRKQGRDFRKREIVSAVRDSRKEAQIH
jgi:hypothetical protein